MKAYLLDTSPDQFQSYLVAVSDDLDVLERWLGKPAGTSWQPVPLELDKENLRRRRPLPRGDFPCIFTGRMLAMSQRAVDTLRDLLEPVGEILPTTCEAEPLWLYNCTRYADVLDEEHSDLQRFTSSNRIMRIKRHVWKPAVAAETIFRLPQIHNSPIYVTDTVVERIRSARLVGYELRE